MHIFFSTISEESKKGFVYRLSLHKYSWYSARKATVPPYTGAAIRWGEVT